MGARKSNLKSRIAEGIPAFLAMLKRPLLRSQVAQINIYLFPPLIHTSGLRNSWQVNAEGEPLAKGRIQARGREG